MLCNCTYFPRLLFHFLRFPFTSPKNEVRRQANYNGAILADLKNLSISQNWNTMGTMNIKIIKQPITKAEAREIAQEFYVEMVKGVADIEKGIIALGGEYHVDANAILIRNGSQQKDVWGFNLYPDRTSDSWIEYTSLINIRPSANNRSMNVEDEKIRAKIKTIVGKLVI